VLGVGVGMVPRGEVGLIIAGIGRSRGVIPDSVFSAVVLMSIATTLLGGPTSFAPHERCIPGGG
jgi:Kef-type K+ transport system membrane component KefB